MDISIVIPAYNEEKRIEKTIQKIIAYCAKNFTQYEIIVVDDCSRDKTAEIVSQYHSSFVKLLHNDINRGKGYSVKRGLLEATYPYVLFSDSDLATPIEELQHFLKHIQQDNDVIIASRNLHESDVRVKQAFYRQLLGRMFPLLVRLIALPGFHDTQCGFKLFKTEAAKKIVQLQTFDRFSFDVEILFIARKLGYAIKEAPVTWIDQPGSTVSPFKDGFRMLMDIFKIRYNDMRGKYSL